MLNNEIKTALHEYAIAYNQNPTEWESEKVTKPFDVLWNTVHATYPEIAAGEILAYLTSLDENGTINHAKNLTKATAQLDEYLKLDVGFKAIHD